MSGKKKPPSKRWVKGATKSPLSSISGNTKFQRRREKEDESKLRTWRRDAAIFAAKKEAKGAEKSHETSGEESELAGEANNGLLFVDKRPSTRKN